MNYVSVGATGATAKFADVPLCDPVARCVSCSRPLKDPVSMARGMGAVCFGKAAKADSGALLGDHPVLNGVGTLDEVGLICRRLADGRLACNVPHDVTHHQPNFDVGSGGGAAELALNVLHQLLPHKGPLCAFVSGDAYRLHQAAKWRFIAPMSAEGGRVPIEDIYQWLAVQLAEDA